MWVRILSGNRAGQVLDLRRDEAEISVSTGFARWAEPDEIKRLAGDDAATSLTRAERRAVKGEPEPTHPTDAPEQNGNGDVPPAPEPEVELPGELEDEDEGTEPPAAEPEVELPGELEDEEEGPEPEAETEPETEPETEAEAPETPAEPAPAYTLRHHGGGKYDVLDGKGTAQNESPLTKVQAQDLLEELTGSTD